MSKLVSIKLTKVGPTAGPFNIYDQSDNLIAEEVSKKALIEGAVYTVSDIVTMVRLVSVGKCDVQRVAYVNDITRDDYNNIVTTEVPTGCVWRHLKNPEGYNYFYGQIHPYIIEYPISTSPLTKILQSITDYTKVYRYTKDEYDISNTSNKIELDDEYFSQVIIYNNQQCSGMLNLVPKPKHNLKEYNTYPIYNTDSKTITFTKTSNVYNINNFWDIVKDKEDFIFIRGCEPLSFDKELNQTNMDYSTRSFVKPTIRAKDVRIRYILNNRSDINLVTQFIMSESMISYK